jgi:diaminohydroxyphosphoribosylaminopyrimidine deaminase / 5-amino-6-(5-phosphoribosylamino)uracil reductase
VEKMVKPEHSPRIDDYCLDQLELALHLAVQSMFATSPNPHVGCVITSPQGNVLGQGQTQLAGGAHAEVMALQNAVALGHAVVGAIAFVTLEPCAHFGRTPPCCNALVEAKIAKAIISQVDPNPLVGGFGIASLRAAGIEVEVLPPNHLNAIASREINIGFFSRMIRKTPWVRIKVAVSLDGTTALENGQSQWITSDAARADGHAWRARSCAVLTGIGTVLQDNPRLDVRLVETPRQPMLVVVDSRLETPLDAHLFIGGRALLIYCAVRNDAKQAALEAAGATVVFLPDQNGKVDLGAMLKDLAIREVNELHVEAGSKLNGSLIRAGLVDEFLVYVAPKLIGLGQGIASFGPLQSLADAIDLEFLSAELVGPDLRVVARVAGRDQF